MMEREKSYYLRLAFVLFAAVLIPTHLMAQKDRVSSAETRILFVFDASFSMSGQWESDSKMNVARDILAKMADSLQEKTDVLMGLRVYGHQYSVPPQRCDDTRLEVPFGQRNSYLIKRKLYNIKPRGTTPIARSLEEAANDFPPCNGNCRNIIILITDGVEECRGDPCAVSEALREKGIVLKPFVIGIGLDEGLKETFNCVGKYYDATHEEQLEEIMNVVISQALNSTTAQVNLLDQTGRPTETNISLSFYDQASGKVLYNYVHTMNAFGVPDTVYLDPLITYRMKVHTTPTVWVDSIEITAGKHNYVAAYTPQGYLTVNTEEVSQFGKLKVLVRKSGSPKTLHVQDVNYSERYLTGYYDIEILTRPRILLDSIRVGQSHTTKIDTWASEPSGSVARRIS
jgi:Ca-activated chloride channel homolog